MSDETPRMTKEQAREKLDDSDFMIIDVRQSGGWELSSTKIQGAMGAWEGKYSKDKTVLIYCS